MISTVYANAGLFLKYFSKFGITTPLRIAHFLGQIAHESRSFTKLTENLNYRPIALMTLSGFAGRFTQEQANKLGFIPGKQKANQVEIANIAYGSRLGNRGYLSGDGWKFRGRGYKQLTGRYNYQKFKEWSGIDVVSNPDLVSTPEIAMLTAVWFWDKGNPTGKSLNILADKNNIELVTKGINGGINGLKDRILKTKFFQQEKITLDVLKKKIKKINPNKFNNIFGSIFNNREYFFQKTK